MVRCISVILVGMVGLLPCTTQTPTQADDSHFVSISLPPHVPSETVQISYYLVGPFGGYGSYAVRQFDLERSSLKGKVFRSDSGEPVSNSYILLAGEKDEEKHFDTRTDEAGNYIFGHIPTGSYTVSIYAWFARKDEVPSQNPHGQKTADGGDITVEWQRKSQAFMQIVTIRGFSIKSEWENVKDFDLTGK